MSVLPAIDPSNAASPNLNTPPSLATSHYPRPSAVGTMPVIDASSLLPAMDPENWAVATVNAAVYAMGSLAVHCTVRRPPSAVRRALWAVPSAVRPGSPGGPR
ncbi:MAG: hypothetical protein M0Z63_00685 [Actinomycetota bacterium]|nr:hypothetical protein [Actinomycetota bacterium]